MAKRAQVDTDPMPVDPSPVPLTREPGTRYEEDGRILVEPFPVAPAADAPKEA